MSSFSPAISIGLPVYNGQDFLAQTLESIIRQTFGNFELIISDNCSSDATEQICLEYSAGDHRIRYFRQTVNRGAAWNYNHVFELARARYFKWAAHDDLIEPMFLEKCVAELDRDPTAVLACTAVKRIDQSGQMLNIKAPALHTDDPSATRRFCATLVYVPFEAVFGVIRSHVLRGTDKIGSYANSDEVLLRELALHGRLIQIDDPLFLSRDHPGNSMQKYPSPAQRAAWFDPNARRRTTFPICRESVECIRAIKRSALPSMQRMMCYLHLAQWLRWNGRRLMHDLWQGLRQTHHEQQRATTHPT